MSAILKDFEPMVANSEKKNGVRIEHICTGESTVEPLPYLVNAQRRSDRHGGRSTWVLVGSEVQEGFLIDQLRSILSTRAHTEVESDAAHNDDEGRWGVRGTDDLRNLAPETDCIVVTTINHALVRLMAAKGSAPKQFSNNMTFMLHMGCGELRMDTAFACNRLVRFAFDTKDTSDHFICTISSAREGPFRTDWVQRRQDCRAVKEGENARSVHFSTETKPRTPIDNMIEGLKLSNQGRAIMLMDDKNEIELDRVDRHLRDWFYRLAELDEDAPVVRESLSEPSLHVIVDEENLTYPWPVPGATHVIIIPWRSGHVWDRETSQVVFRPGSLLRNKAELKFAMRLGWETNAPEIHYLGSREVFDNLEEDPIDSMAYTTHFDDLVLSCLAVWPEFSVAQMPLKFGRNPDLVEERLRRLMYKGLLVVDGTREPILRPEELLRSYSFLKPTIRGRLASHLVNPYFTIMQGVDAACLVGQLLEKMQSTPNSVIDAICGLAVVSASVNGVVFIDAIIKPKENYKVYTDNPHSLAFDHCHRGPLWMAVCVLHSAVSETDPRFKVFGCQPHSFDINDGTMTLSRHMMTKWINIARDVQKLLERCGIDADCGNEQDRLTPGDLLDVEDMLITAFMDKLAFVLMPAGGSPFGYSMTAQTELERPTNEQMRLIDLDKCWEEDKKAGGQETAGIFCIFTHYCVENVDGREVRRPYDLTHVSTEAVRRALSRVDAPIIEGDLFSKIQSTYKLDP